MSVRDIAFHIDETWEMDCTATDADGHPMTIEAAEWRLASDVSRFVLVSVGDGITVNGPGVCTVVVPPSRQGGVTVGVYDHELWVVDAATHAASIQIKGKANIVQSLKRKFP